MAIYIPVKLQYLQVYVQAAICVYAVIVQEKASSEAKKYPPMLKQAQKEALKLHDELQRAKDRAVKLEKEGDKRLLDEKEKVKTVRGASLVKNVTCHLFVDPLQVNL